MEGWRWNWRVTEKANSRFGSGGRYCVIAGITLVELGWRRVFVMGGGRIEWGVFASWKIDGKVILEEDTVTSMEVLGVYLWVLEMRGVGLAGGYCR